MRRRCFEVKLFHAVTLQVCCLRRVYLYRYITHHVCGWRLKIQDRCECGHPVSGVEEGSWNKYRNVRDTWTNKEDL